MSERIFIVEDQEDLRGALRDLLTGSGYTVIEAGDGEADVAEAVSSGVKIAKNDRSEIGH